MQRTKGASYEREVCAVFTEALDRPIKRKIGQARDGGNDIDVGPLRVECKRRKSLGTLESWMEQAEEGCPLDKHPAVVTRSDGGESMIVMKLDDFLALAGDRLGDR
jgi:hypothetical protein